MPDNLRLRVLVEVDAQTGDLKIVEQGLEDVQQQTDRNTQSNRRNADSTTEQTNQLRSLRGELAAAAAAAAALYGVFRGGAAVINTTALFEQFELRLAVFAETSGEAARNYEELLRYAALTPFSVQGVIDSFLQLESTSFEPQLSDLQAIGNIAAATARPLEEFVNALTAAGRSEFDPLEGFGFTIRKENEQIRIEFRDTVKVVDDNRRQILQAFVDIANERDEFAGATEILAASLTGALANLGDSIDQTLVQVGQGGLASAVSDLARSLSAAADGGAPLARALGAVAGAGVRVAPVAVAVGAVYVQTRLLNGVLAATPGIMGRVTLSAAGLTAAATGLATTLGRFLGPAGIFLLLAEGAALFAASQDDAVASTSRLRQELDNVAESYRTADRTARNPRRDDPFFTRTGRDERGNQRADINLAALPRVIGDFFTTTDDELRARPDQASAQLLALRLEEDVHQLYDRLLEANAALQTALENNGATEPLREDLAATRRALAETLDEYESVLQRVNLPGDTRADEIPAIRGAVANVRTPGVPDTLAPPSSAAQSLLAEIVGLETSLLPEAEQARRKILDQQAQLLESLRELGPGYQEYETRINAVTRALLDQVDAAEALTASQASQEELESFIALVEEVEAEIAEFEQARDARVQGAVEQIARASADQFDVARIEAVQWESDMLAILSESPAAWAQWADEVARITEERLAAINQQQAEATEPGTLLSGVQAGLDEYITMLGDIHTNAEHATIESFKRMEDAILEFRRTGEVEVGALVNFIIDEFARIVIRQAILAPLAQGLSAALGNVFGGGGAGAAFGPAVPGSGQGIALAPVFGVGHTGAVVPNWPEYRAVDPALLAGAERYHSGYGLRPGESLGIFEAGEVILSRDQVAALRGNGAAPAAPPEVRLNFENRGNPVEPEVQSQRWDGRTLVIDVMLEDMARRGPFSQGLRRTFGLREQSV